MTRLLRNEVMVGDALTRLIELPTGSVDTVVTSPPYWALRDYGVPGQLGSEPTIDTWVDALTEVASELRRVLVPTGSLWLNLGDTYATHQRQGAARKSLLLGPERLALRLVGDGWILRNKIVWQKTNPMPTSVRDRLACTWEAVYLLTIQPRAFFDLDAIRLPHRSHPAAHRSTRFSPTGRERWRGPNAGTSSGLDVLRAAGRVGHPLGKNPGDVWRIASSSYRSPHRATFPLALTERAVLAGCPEARCTRCRTPWRRSIIRAIGGTATRGALGPTCDCATGSEPGLVIDPFIGSGTTAVAAERHSRDWLGIELNPAYADLARRRVHEARAGPQAA